MDEYALIAILLVLVVILAFAVFTLARRNGQLEDMIARFDHDHDGRPGGSRQKH